MKVILRFCVALIAVAFAASATAQVQTGSILVKAVDQQGAVVPGVTTTISSPVLVGGSMTGVSDAGGAYRFPSLVPGTYQVKLELSGFQTLVREGIVVLRLLISEKGAVDNVAVVRAEPRGIFEQAAIEAFSKARFSPGLAAGTPVKSQITVEVQFMPINRGARVSGRTY